MEAFAAKLIEVTANTRAGSKAPTRRLNLCRAWVLTAGGVTNRLVLASRTSRAIRALGKSQESLSEGGGNIGETDPPLRRWALAPRPGQNVALSASTN